MKRLCFLLTAVLVLAASSVAGAGPMIPGGTWITSFSVGETAFSFDRWQVYGDGLAAPGGARPD